MNPPDLSYHIPMNPEPGGAPGPIANSTAKRVAFFGGSFDPPHLGRIAVALAAQQALNLNQVLFAPVGLQPLKPTGSSASFEDRVAMTRLAIEAHPTFAISLLDAPAPNILGRGNAKPNYTRHTLIELKRSEPANTALHLLLGADSFRTIRHWHRASEIPFLADLIVASRPGEDLTDLSTFLPAGITLGKSSTQPNQYLLFGPAGGQSLLTVLPDLNYDISATQLRKQVHGPSGGEPSLLDPAVLDYILSHHLYE